MLKLFRTVGAAVVLGVGARAGSELYDILKKHARRRRTRDEEHAPTEETGATTATDHDDEDIEAREAHLKAERQRINRELERIRRKRARGK